MGPHNVLLLHTTVNCLPSVGGAVCLDGLGFVGAVSRFNPKVVS